MTPTGEDQTLLDRMVFAVEKVRQRLLRVSEALDNAGVNYAVAGGNAVAAWVASVDPAAVRNTQDVDILLRRVDLPLATSALQAVGFVYQNVSGVDMFLDTPESGVRDAVHVIPAAEKIRPEYTLASPDVTESEQTGQFRLVHLEALVKMKLTSYRRKDQVHLLDLLGVGLIDPTWISRLPAQLAGRLQELLDTRED